MADWEKELVREIAALSVMLREREAIEVKIAKQRQRVAALQVLTAPEDETEDESPAMADIEGLTDACRTVLRGSTKGWMTTAEIQRSLRELGFPLEKYKAPHASILTTVNRMTEGDNPEVAVNRSATPGGTEYKWVGSSRFSEATRKRFAAKDQDLEKPHSAPVATEERKRRFRPL